MTITPTKKVDILLTAPMSRTAEALSGNRFNLHRLWEVKDEATFFAETGPKIRGIAAGGHAPINAAFTERLPALEIIANFGVGYDRIDVQHAAKKGYIVTNTPDVLNEEVADLTLGLLLCTVRNLPQSERFLREGRWTSSNFPL